MFESSFSLMLRERPKSSNKRRSYKGDSSATIDDEENETGRLKDWQISRKDENQRSFVAMQITANKLENDGLNSVLCSMQIHDPLHKHRHTHSLSCSTLGWRHISMFGGTVWVAILLHVWVERSLSCKRRRWDKHGER